jgi:hypothetical protein
VLANKRAAIRAALENDGFTPTPCRQLNWFPESRAEFVDDN